MTRALLFLAAILLTGALILRERVDASAAPRPTDAGAVFTPSVDVVGYLNNVQCVPGAPPLPMEAYLRAQLPDGGAARCWCWPVAADGGAP